MSNWTHVAGLIRFDSLLHDELERDIPNAFGETWQYGDDEYLASPVPFGSEGSLQYVFNRTGFHEGNVLSITCGNLAIWGDLRDYEDPFDIYNWVVESIQRMKYGFIRSMCIKIEVESLEGFYLIYDIDQTHIKMEYYSE